MINSDLPFAVTVPPLTSTRQFSASKVPFFIVILQLSASNFPSFTVMLKTLLAFALQSLLRQTFILLCVFFIIAGSSSVPKSILTI